MVVELLPTSNREVGATLLGVRPEKKYEVQHEFARNRQSEGMDIMMKDGVTMKEEPSGGRARDGRWSDHERRAILHDLGKGNEGITGRNDWISSKRNTSSLRCACRSDFFSRSGNLSKNRNTHC